MKSLLFIFGRTPALSFLELKTFFPDAEMLGDLVAKCDVSTPIEAQNMIAMLGGTVKIAEFVDTLESVTPEALAQFLKIDGRVVFGVSGYGVAKVQRSLLESIKKLVEAKGVSVRFVESRTGEALTSVVLEHDRIQELILVQVGNRIVIGKTIAAQPFEMWSKRDFGRPFADPKAGMLPPKVSRMAVNIADRTRDGSKPRNGKTLLDPFCGMGTILAEALFMGWNVVGSDQSAAVSQKADANLRWTIQNGGAAQGVTYRMNTSDAVHVSEVVGAPVDAIVTEPYMGPTELATRTANPKEIKNIIKGLEKLYIGCLRDWHGILKDGGVVEIALPRYSIAGREYFVKKVIDMCETLGYTILAGPIEYSRPQAVVKRAFYLFQKK